jgi:hypothetical protein
VALAARPGPGRTPGPGDRLAGPRLAEDAQVASGISRRPGASPVLAAMGAMRTRITFPPGMAARLTAVPPPGPRPPGRAACPRSRPASPSISWTPRLRPSCGPCPLNWPR